MFEELIESTDKIAALVQRLTLDRVIQAVSILGLTYLAFLILDNTISWLSEHVPLQFRLSIKQSLPFCRALVLLVAIVLLLSRFLQLSPSSLLALIAFFLVGLGFAFKDYASSVSAGLISLFEQPYQVGDHVKIGEQYGEVTRYGLRGIRLRTSDDRDVTIPHNYVWTQPVVNSNRGKLEALVAVSFYLSHHADVNQVIQILRRVAQTSKYTDLRCPIAVELVENPESTQFSLETYPMDIRDETSYRTDLIRRAKAIFKQQAIAYPPPFNLKIQG
ncbi:MAG: mechanosensitive ion channel [Leptolyngbyaceae cyanobacterium SM1_1_3]|nr:mechanosensitive ion channel [Leptolyngbyaceae cyanobacterium SM1_1_3]NJN01990.1 mechanosensitive ion channel [Leptolyngbyaceae cyanobacterium RM1_1_2]NJO10115.1 mechanosensitive ion channel [Leptolyngbyaceae cyanobacterium SL_1_1]